MTHASHPGPPPASLLPTSAWDRAMRDARPLVEVRPWGRIRWQFDGTPMQATVRAPGQDLDPWPTLVLGTGGAGLLVGSVAGGSDTRLLLLALGIALLLGAAGLWRHQLGRGRTFAGPDLADALSRDADLLRIAARHDEAELEAAAARSHAHIWRLGDPELTPAERRRTADRHAGDARLAREADAHLVALGDQAPQEALGEDPADEDLERLVSALEAARRELTGYGDGT
ncbi:MAG: hypothetical protein AB7G37_11010 [Solirubrobacteraceae bacterium]